MMKQAAIEAVEAANPVRIQRGSVVETSPLKIKVSQKISLTKEQIVTCRGIGPVESGDTVILLQQQGGQEYIVLGVEE